ncbi:MAG: hypothetical protein ACK46X_21715 [Candidatus Sericytochromatia bacterium]
MTLPPFLSLPFDLLFAFVGMAIVGVSAVPLIVGAVSRQPREDADGLWLKDHHDGWGGVAAALLKVFPAMGFSAVAVFFGYGIARGMSTRDLEGLWPLVLIAGVFGLVGPVFLFLALRRVWVLSTMAPGEIQVPAWPLRPGTSLELRFRRQLHREAQLNGLSARLVRYRRVRSGKSSYLSEDEVIPVPALNGRIRDGCLEATIPMQVPPPVRASFWETGPSVLGMAPEKYWHLEIQPDFEGLTDEDAVFQLVIEAPGR